MLPGKTLILTGASRGIGRALALGLAREGVRLVLNARDPAPLEEVKAACLNLGGEAFSVAGDAAQAGVAAALVSQALEMGNFYGFIHAAGVLHPGPYLWELPQESFREVLDSHLVAAYQLVRYAVPPLLREGEGVAVFFGSYAAVSNLPGIGAYCVAKAALEHLARQLAQEAPQLTTFVFRPGATETRMQEQARSATGGAAPILHRTFRGYLESGRLDTPEEAAARLIKVLFTNPRAGHGRIVT